MTYRRWYPTLVTLENGDVVALSGNRSPSQRATIPERWNGSTWTPLTGANLSVPLYPRAFVEPKNGHVFLAGESTVRSSIPPGPGPGHWGPSGSLQRPATTAPPSCVDSKVLYAGGGGSGCPGTPERSAEIIDLAAPSPTWTATGSMAIARRQTNLTVLPDGKVLMTGGSSACGFSNETGAVFAAEMWDPAAGARGLEDARRRRCGPGVSLEHRPAPRWPGALHR